MSATRKMQIGKICEPIVGEVAEWLNATHSKCVLGQLNGGSNPPLSVVMNYLANSAAASHLPARGDETDTLLKSGNPPMQVSS
jgi:hypothetical protein